MGESRHVQDTASIDSSVWGQGCHLSRDHAHLCWSCPRGHLLAIVSPDLCIGCLSCLEGPYFKGHVKRCSLASRQPGASASLQGEGGGQMGVLETL